MASLAEYGDAVVAGLVAALPTVPTVELYAGQFGADDAARVQFRAPAVFVALDQVSVGDPGTEELELELTVRAYCVAQSARSAAARGVSAAALAEAVALVAQRQQWGLAATRPAMVSQLRSLFSTRMDRAGLGIWSVEWRQVLRTGESVWDDAAVEPIDVTSVWLGLDPRIGPDHLDDYEEVVGG